ncbi:flagellin lysine-N-methylase [Selenomonas sp. AB3002]|uniref:flagellin lysine-N-methylase n=1 Tax=Selenomonas sp. AB3002 TaxID=1392502 RepID=UPI000495F914
MLKTIYPDFYEDFCCKADKCQHTCCAGWEIDIDAATAARYQQLAGPVGEAIRQNIVEVDGTWQFVLGPGGRCPFLRRDGLCELIRRADESVLCDICANHPRFFVSLGDYELAGVGLSCEKSCELLLAEEKPLHFRTEAGKKLSLKEVLQRLSLPVSDEDLCYRAGLTADDAAFVLDCLQKTEPIDEAWTAQLAQLRSADMELEADAPQAFDRIYQYILYRALEHVPQYGWGTVLSYAQLNTDFIYLHYQLTGELAESTRRWSEQIEYSTENVRLLMELLA